MPFGTAGVARPTAAANSAQRRYPERLRSAPLCGAIRIRWQADTQLLLFVVGPSRYLFAGSETSNARVRTAKIPIRTMPRYCFAGRPPAPEFASAHTASCPRIELQSRQICLQ